MAKEQTKPALIGNIIRIHEEKFINDKGRTPPDEWYGYKFDVLYEKSSRHLELIYKSNQHKVQ